jgi:lipid A 3-O-deacylase
MKKRFLPAVCASVVVSTLVFCTIAMADPKGYGISGGYGVSRDNIDIYRLGVQKQFSSHWFDSRMGVLSGYFELSCNLWEKSGEKIHGVAFSPVFVYYFSAGGSRGITPYVEGGIGAACIDDYTIADRNLSTNFQFENRIGMGFIINRVDIKLGYMHYSNASIRSPNDGIDIWSGTVAWHF